MLRRAGPMLLFVLAVLVAAPSAMATVLSFGTSGVATIFFAPNVSPEGLTTPHGTPLGTVADTGVVPFFGSGIDNGNVVTIGGKFRAIAFKDSAITFSGCSGGDCLTFLYLVSNDSDPDNIAIQRIATSSFGSFLGDIGYADSGSWRTGIGTDVAPTAISRSFSNSIGYDFLNITAGNGSSVLEIQTNAKNWRKADVSISQGVVASASGFAPDGPKAAVEPASALLLGVSLLMGGVFRKKLFA